MSRTRPLPLSCALAAAGLFLAGQLAAFNLLSPNRTWRCPPDYVVDNAGLASVSDGSGGVTYIVNAINSTNAWNGGSSGKVVKAHAGSTAGFTLGDGVPMLKLSDPLGICTGSCLAATLLGYYSERVTGSGSWEIDDADIVTNSTGFNWTSVGEDPFNVGCSNEVFGEGVMVHEVGHGLGLAHSAVSGATMSPGAALCDGSAITTEADDENGLAALYGTAPCTGCPVFTEYLPGTGTTRFHGECGTFYHSASAGIHYGYLRGPVTTDFDVYLYWWNGTGWQQVASGTSSFSSENVAYNGPAGWYLWEVKSYSGSGTYHFWLNRP